MSNILFPAAFSEKLDASTPDQAEILYFEQFSSDMQGGNGHPYKMKDLVHGLTAADFAAQGLDPRSPDIYSDLELGSARITNLEASGRNDVPIGAFLIKKLTAGCEVATAPAIGPAIFQREATESYRTRSKLAAIQSKLGGKSRDAGIRYFTSWVKRQPPEIVSRVFKAGIQIATEAGLDEMKVVQVSSDEHPVITNVEQTVDLTDPQFGFTGGKQETVTIEGNAYTGRIFTRELR